MTNSTTETHATEATNLRLRRPQLIGTFGAEGAMGALLRLPSGDIQRLSVGHRGALGTVTGIEPGAVHIALAGRTRVLRLPRS